MMKQLYAIYSLIRLYRWRWLFLSLGFTLLYYTMILVFTVIRFQEIPNYVNFENVFHVYHLILSHTPSLSDAIPILTDEAFFETGFKDPNYYGVATWSYMLIPPKMLVVLLMAMLFTTFIILKSHTKQTACMQKKPIVPTTKLTTTAGIGTMLISLTNVTLSWVVCCATPNWSVALTMLGLSSSVSLWLNPYGMYMTIIGLVLLVLAVFYQAHYLAKINPSLIRLAN
jgi:hypothetical protein